MKKHTKSFFLLFIFQLISWSFLQAQDVNFGLVAGFNSFKFDGAQTWNEKVNSGYYLGGAFEFEFSKKFSIQPEIQIQFDKQKNPSGENIKTKTLNVPLLITWTPFKLLSLQFGPQYSKYIGGWDEIQLFDRNFYKKENMSLLGGIQINTPIVKIGARIDQGLMKINNFDDIDDIKTMGFKVYLLKNLF